MLYANKDTPIKQIKEWLKEKVEVGPEKLELVSIEIKCNREDKYEIEEIMKYNSIKTCLRSDLLRIMFSLSNY